MSCAVWNLAASTARSLARPTGDLERTHVPQLSGPRSSMRRWQGYPLWRFLVVIHSVSMSGGKSRDILVDLVDLVKNSYPMPVVDLMLARGNGATFAAAGAVRSA